MERVLSESNELNKEFLKNKKLFEKFDKEMQTKYKNLHTTYPSIYKVAMTPKYDYDRLKFMLEMSEKIKSKEITEHDASVKVGEVLVNDIVKPQLKK
jgi:hypothetical protein